MRCLPYATKLLWQQTHLFATAASNSSQVPECILNVVLKPIARLKECRQMGNFLLCSGKPPSVAHTHTRTHAYSNNSIQVQLSHRHLTSGVRQQHFSGFRWLCWELWCMCVYVYVFESVCGWHSSVAARCMRCDVVDPCPGHFCPHGHRSSSGADRLVG